MTRDPFQRAYSHYRFNKERSEEPFTFTEAVFQERDGARKNWLLRGYCRGSDPDPARQQIVRSFSKDCLLELELHSDGEPASQIDEVLKFLELPELPNLHQHAQQAFSNRSHTDGELSGEQLWLKRSLRRLRAMSPRVFDQPLFRRPYEALMDSRLWHGLTNSVEAQADNQADNEEQASIVFWQVFHELTDSRYSANSVLQNGDDRSDVPDVE